MDSAVYIPARKSFDNGEAGSDIFTIVEKVWGHEEWIVNNEKYCGKKMVINKGYACSLHYHKIKEETFYLLSGSVLLELEVDKKITKHVLIPGSIAHVNPFSLHRFTALESSVLMEFSTHHDDNDSYRVEKSRRVDISSLAL